MQSLGALLLTAMGASGAIYGKLPTRRGHWVELGDWSWPVAGAVRLRSDLPRRHLVAEVEPPLTGGIRATSSPGPIGRSSVA